MPPSRTFWLVVAVAFGLRALLLLRLGPDPAYALMPDSASYFRPAQELLHHGAYATFRDGQLVPELYRTPGYPLFLLPFLDSHGGVHYRAVQWTQALLNAFAAGLIYLAALSFWGRAGGATAAGLALAIDFVNAIHCSFVLTDILFVFLISAMILMLVRQRFLAAGAMTAAAAFVRPIGLYYPILVAPLLFWGCLRAKDWRCNKLVLFLIISLLPALSWMARNHRVAGRWTFCTLQDANLFLVRAALVDMDRKHITYEVAVQDVSTRFQESTDPSMTERTWAMGYLQTQWKDYGRLMAKDVVKFLTGNSMKVAAWALLKDEYYNPYTVPEHSMLTPMEQARELNSRHSALGICLGLYLGFLGITYALALAGFWIAWREKGALDALIVSSSIFYFTVLTLGVDAQARYRLPVMPALFILAAGGWDRLFRRPS